MSAPLKRPSSAERALLARQELEPMSPAEWESLCDGCGRCCLVKLEEEDTRGHPLHGCRLHPSRRAGLPLPRLREPPGKVPDCVRLTPERGAQLSWLPPPAPTGSWPRARPLLVAPPGFGGPATVHAAGISVRGARRRPGGGFLRSGTPGPGGRWPADAPRGRAIESTAAAAGTGTPVSNVSSVSGATRSTATLRS